MEGISWSLMIPRLISNLIYLIEATVTIFVLLFAVRYMKRNLLQNDEIISKIERLVVIQEQKQSTHFSTKESDE
ncbi:MULTISPECIES: hypothetical protein [Brevibacillus]|uniref:Uncharacterized protein n=1 Tax=Brevibacillus parabrevis TaxID=54914 RepID=A0A4Y3PTT3_BREPA|nr:MULTISPECIES: hypothetical protein [Brevibacillus]NRQ55697.1 hypothetical protein [Brevibacillus sp. HD1.4A]RNB95008.1 hypothetical protein EDM60_14150 [Brevibacillus parabrevis]GEB34509.1 hypothetical protein BPA01_40890 [Brevibacillus parabrevis]